MRFESKKREDVRALNSIEAATTLSSLHFEQFISLLVDFIATEIVRDSDWQLKGIGDTTKAAASLYLETSRQFIENAISASELEQARVAAWKTHDKLPVGSLDRELIRLLICCLYDAESAEYEAYGLEPYIETVVTSLLAIGAGYCEKFAAFSQKAFPKQSP